MKNHKRLLALLLALAMCLALAACGNKPQNALADEQETVSSDAETQQEEQAETPSDGGADAESDLKYVQDKGTLVIGITEFEPMDYQDADGNWVGFDADMARAFAESIGVEPVFQITDWDNKVFELEGRTIDVVWNGMTLTDEVRASMECSNPYFNNAQVVVVPMTSSAAFASPDATMEDLSSALFAVESGSAGKQQAELNNFQFTEVADQATALLEVSSGNADAAIIDFLMAKAMTGPGTSYEGLGYTVSLNSEEYGVGFRQGSDMAAALNDFFAAAYADGSMQQIAETYNIAEMLVAQ